MSSTHVYSSAQDDDEECAAELDRATVDRVIAHIHNEEVGGTFGGMDGDSAALWIIARLSHLLAHPEDL